MTSWDRISLVRLLSLSCTACMLLLIAACSSGQPVPAARLQPEQVAPASWDGQFPGLPESGTPSRQASATSYTFREADQSEGMGASWQDLELTLATSTFTYAILGQNVGETQPSSIHMTGTLNDVWLGISDYGSGSWLWLGEYSADAEVALPAGDYANVDGMMYVALVCPAGSDTVQTTTLVFGGELDTDPPDWQGSEGIATAKCEFYDGVISWNPAVDAESGPVEYLVYYARSDTGINWESPRFVLPAEITSTRFFIGTEEPTDFDFAVRARDGAGNVTPNTNFMSALNIDGQLYPIVEWVPGDRFVMSSFRSDLSFTFDLLYSGPGDYLEGGPEDHWGLEGLIDFSPDNINSGLDEEWAKLLPTSPLGPYTVEARISNWDTTIADTVSFQLLDSLGEIKRDFGNYTFEPKTGTGFDMAMLAHGTWPRDLYVVPGDTLEVSWPDPNANIELCIEGPHAGWAGPSFPEDLAGKIEFSPDSEDSGVGLEWAKVLPGALAGIYHASLQWWGYDGTPPEFVTVSIQLLDSEGALKVDLGSLELPPEGGVYPLAQMQYWPE